MHAWLQPNGSWGESNAALVVGDRASLLVDTLWDVRLTARMLAAMQPLVAQAPIATMVNTHSDGDHWWGNQLVARAEIVATEAAAQVMAHQSPAEMLRFGRLGAGLRTAGGAPRRYPRRDDVATVGRFVGDALRPFAFGEVRLARPTRTFRGELALEVGGREVRLIEVGPAHTPGDLVVHVPDARTVLAADILFIGVTPVMWAGPVKRWLAALDRLSSRARSVRARARARLRRRRDRAARGLLALADGRRRAPAPAARSPGAVARELVLGTRWRPGASRIGWIRAGGDQRESTPTAAAPRGRRARATSWTRSRAWRCWPATSDDAHRGHNAVRRPAARRVRLHHRPGQLAS